MPTVQLLPAGRSVVVSRGARLIDVIREAGLPIASACGDDLICARCGVRILAGDAGREAETEREAKRRNRVRAELRLACAVRVRGDIALSADYWGEAQHAARPAREPGT
jgi:ferredoxin